MHCFQINIIFINAGKSMPYLKNYYKEIDKWKLQEIQIFRLISSQAVMRLKKGVASSVIETSVWMQISLEIWVQL